MKVSIFALSIAALSLTSTASAVIYNVGPDDLAAGKPTFSTPHGSGTNPFGFDWDSAKPDVAPGAPAGYGLDSFSANVSQGGATQPDRYRTFRIGTTSLFSAPITINDLSSIAYETNKPGAQTAIDWRLTIYTTPGDKAVDPTDGATGAGDTASWYRSRLQANPSGSDGLNAPANQWNTWTTNDTTNQLLFFSNKAGDFNNSSLEWSALRAGSVNGASGAWNFSGEEIMMIDITLGANNGGGTGVSALDAVVLTLANGQVADINLIPEPGALGLLAMGGIMLIKRRRA